MRFEKSFENSLVEAWKNSEKSAVVGVGDTGGQVDVEAGLTEEHGVPTSMYLISTHSVVETKMAYKQ